MSRRIQGKASFAEIQDSQGRIQVYFNRDELCPSDDKKLYNDIYKKLLDIGDIIGIEGVLFTTQVGEKTVMVKKFTILNKSLKPLPLPKVDSEGIKALKELAKVLEDQKDLEILVEGHTDTDKMKSKSHPVDNWELSVLRATSVVKIMLANSKMDPTTVSATGRSQYIPIDVKDKSRNRRIEVVLIPKLDELFEIINN